MFIGKTVVALLTSEWFFRAVRLGMSFNPWWKCICIVALIAFVSLGIIFALLCTPFMFFRLLFSSMWFLLDNWWFNFDDFLGDCFIFIEIVISWWVVRSRCDYIIFVDIISIFTCIEIIRDNSICICTWQKIEKKMNLNYSGR